MSAAIGRLLTIMARLRDPDTGCPWDLKQDFRSLAPYAIEEAYEVEDAVERNDLPALRDELGDLLFQIAFHSQLAQERGAFDFEAVATAICDKMERRHPHVFGTERITTADQQTVAWEEHKRRERSQRAAASVLDDIPLALPALTRAAKIGKRVASVGFEWPNIAGVLDKIEEEIGELREVLGAATSAPATPATAGARALTSPSATTAAAIATTPPPAESLDRLEDELGDVFFSLVNFARHLKIDPERALRRTNQKFERRFRYIESRLAAHGRTPAQSDLKEMDELWAEAKQILMR